MFLFFKDPSRVDFCPGCLIPPWQPAAHLRDLDWKVQSFVLFVSFCGTIALKAEIVCLVGRRDKTKFDLAPPGVDLELPMALASTFSHSTAFSWAFQRGGVAGSVCPGPGSQSWLASCSFCSQILYLHICSEAAFSLQNRLRAEVEENYYETKETAWVSFS